MAKALTRNDTLHPFFANPGKIPLSQLPLKREVFLHFE